MANTLGVYNPIFYAQEALIALHKALGMAGRIHRGYDAERRSFGKGQVISIRRPSTFTAADAPSAAADLTTGTVNLSLDYWREVKFKLTDKELSFTTEQIITEHIQPAAYALADDIDQKLATLEADIPWFYDLASTTVIGDLTGPYQVLFDNKVPMDPAMLHYMINGALQNGFQSLAAFNTSAGGGAAAEATQLRGTLGTKFGMEIFANQNVPTHTAGTGSDNAGAVTGAHLAGATTLVLGSLTDAETLKAGDTLVIAGNTQRYAVTNATTVTVASNAATVTISPPLVAALSGSEVVTIRRDTHVSNLVFHRNAFALATAPLSEIGNELGAKIATITDPVTGLSIRSRLYYVGNSSEVHVALDVLYGFKTLDPNLACVCCG